MDGKKPYKSEKKHGGKEIYYQNSSFIAPIENHVPKSHRVSKHLLNSAHWCCDHFPGKLVSAQPSSGWRIFF